MSSITLLVRQGGRLLSTQVRRLRVNLERLAAQVREAVARTVSQAVAEAAHEALQIVLEGPPAVSAPWQSTPEEFGRPWDTEADDRRGKPPRKPRTLYESLTDDIEPDSGIDPEEREVSEDAPASAPPRRWSRALTVGCQAAAWWLRRRPGRSSGLTAAGIGVAAGLVALLASPLLANAGTVAATALSVLALADAARSAATVASTWL